MFQFPSYTLRRTLTNPGAVTLLQYLAGSAGPAEVLSARLTQGTSATSAQIAAQVVRKTAAATVTAAVAGTDLVKVNPIAPTSNATLSTSGTGHTATVEGTDGEAPSSQGFNVLNGFIYEPTADARIVVPAAGLIALKALQSPPAATYYAEMTVRELRAS